MATRYEYNDDGLLVGSVVEREPEWSRSDVEALIAYSELQRVGPHGYPMDIATSRDGDPSNPERRFDWVVLPPTLDFPSAALDREKAAYKNKYPDADMSSLRWRVEKRER